MKAKAHKKISKEALADKVLKNGTTRPLRKRIQEACLISLDAFGACVGKLVNRERLAEAIKRSFELIALFESAKTERKFFVVTTQTEQKRRGTFAGVADVAEVEIETNDGKRKLTVLRRIDDDKGEAGYMVAGCIEGLRLMDVGAMRDYAAKSAIVQVKTINRFTSEETVFAGAMIGSMADKWQAVIHANGNKTLSVHNIMSGSMTVEEDKLKLTDFSVQLGDLSESDIKTVRAQLLRGTNRTAASGRLRNMKKAHAKKTANVLS